MYINSTFNPHDQGGKIMRTALIFLSVLLVAFPLAAGLGQPLKTQNSVHFSLEPEGYNWGEVNPGLPLVQYFTLTNLGNETLQFELSIGNDYTQSFMVLGENCENSGLLEPHESFELYVELWPRDLEDVYVSANLVLRIGSDELEEYSYLLEAFVTGPPIYCFVWITNVTVDGNNVTIHWEEACPIGRNAEIPKGIFGLFDIYFDGDLLDTIEFDDSVWWYEYTHYCVPEGLHYYQVQGVSSHLSQPYYVNVENPPIYSIDPDDEDFWFGYLPVGHEPSREFTIYNLGGGTMEIGHDDIQLICDAYEAYSLNAPDLPVQITADHPYTFSVIFHPQVEDSLPQRATLTVEDDLGRSLHEYRFSGVCDNNYGAVLWIQNASVSQNTVTLSIIIDYYTALAKESRAAVQAINIFRDGLFLQQIPHSFGFAESYLDYGVPYGWHNYAVQGVFSDGLGLINEPYPVFVDFLAPPAAPEMILDNNRITLYWMPQIGAEWYCIHAADDPYGDWSCLGYVPAAFNGISLNLESRKFFRISSGTGIPPRGSLLEAVVINMTD